jgi:hypothetical protein
MAVVGNKDCLTGSSVISIPLADGIPWKYDNPQGGWLWH